MNPRRMLCGAALAFGLFGTTALAAPLTRDLGANLVYYRVHTLPADLPGVSARPQPSVLDLRYVGGDATAAAAVQGWIKFHATPLTPVLVLVNTQTAMPLLRALAPRPTSVVVIGTARDGFAPDIAIAAAPETERQAYDALEHGSDPASLLADNPDKIRNDEASLSHDRPVEADAAEPDDAPKPHPARPPVDAALQRAVHVHRALVALRKLSAR